MRHHHPQLAKPIYGLAQVDKLIGNTYKAVSEIISTLDSILRETGANNPDFARMNMILSSYHLSSGELLLAKSNIDEAIKCFIKIIYV